MLLLFPLLLFAFSFHRRVNSHTPSKRANIRVIFQDFLELYEKPAMGVLQRDSLNSWYRCSSTWPLEKINVYFADARAKEGVLRGGRIQLCLKSEQIPAVSSGSMVTS